MSKKHDFIEHSILGAVRFLKEATLVEAQAQRQGMLQTWDPRFKTMALVVLIVTAVSLKHAQTIGVLYGLCLVMALWSRLPLGYFLLRTWTFIPLFSLVAALPALFSVVSPGPALWSTKIFGFAVTITAPGIKTAVLFVARIATAVSLAVLLSLTTKHSQLLQALRAFRVPRPFILTAALMYRYLYQLAVMVENTFIAIKSRVGVVDHHRKGQVLVAWNITNLWNRANHMNEEVYLAMHSRGYMGEAQVLNQGKPRARDWWATMVVVTIALGLFWMESKL